MQNPLQSPLQNMQTAIAAFTPVLLAKMGTQAVNYSKENFRRQSFAGVPWAPRKFNKKDKCRAILVKTGHLRNSIHIVSINPQSVTIRTGNLPTLKQTPAIWWNWICVSRSTYDTVQVQVFPLKNAMVKMSTINIFPIPATNILNIENAENCEVYLYDIGGNKVGEVNCHIEPCRNKTIDLSNFMTGVYFVEVVDEETRMKVVRKVVKE